MVVFVLIGFEGQEKVTWGSGIFVRKRRILCTETTNTSFGHYQLSHSYENSFCKGRIFIFQLLVCHDKDDSTSYVLKVSSLILMQELKQLAEELRSETVFNVSKTGGHLGSSLGVVELTVALHYVFNTPQDRILWDVGHQVIILFFLFIYSYGELTEA